MGEMGQDRRNQQVALPSGRKLGFAEYGAASGKPVLYFHGWPGSRVEPQAIESANDPMGVRIIAVDRPGYGLSEFQERRRILDWPQDIARLVEAVGVGRFAVMGVSGGGHMQQFVPRRCRSASRPQRWSVVSGRWIDRAQRPA